MSSVTVYFDDMMAARKAFEAMLPAAETARHSNGKWAVKTPEGTEVLFRVRTPKSPPPPPPAVSRCRCPGNHGGGSGGGRL